MHLSETDQRAHRRRAEGWLIGLIPLALLLWFVPMVGEVARGGRRVYFWDWVPALGASFSILIDGLSLLFAILICAIGFLIFGYSGPYLHEHPHRGRFYVYLLGFALSMLGLVLAGNLITLFIFWELTSLTSYLLIGLDHHRKEARDAALQALLVTGGGGMALLAGFVLLGQAGGSMEVWELSGKAALIQTDPLYAPILLLILLGAFTKSAQFPFHFWLPSAMEAPTPVSAYLHSATMVKAGVYLLARLWPILGGTDQWVILVTTVGTVTMVLGGWLALMSSDLKRILAYSTVSALGTLVLLLGIGTPAAVHAAMVLLVAHALYKAALFLIAGVIDHQTGVRDVDRLGGLRHAMPVTASVAVVAGLSMAGFGPVLNFIGKEMLLETLAGGERAQVILLSAALAGVALAVAVAGLIVIRPFFGRSPETTHDPTEASASLLAGPLLLALAGVALALRPDALGQTMIVPATGAITASWSELHLTLWHGVNLPLILSLVSLGLGVVLYRLRDRMRELGKRAPSLARVRTESLYEQSLRAIGAAARWQTRVLQNGYLRFYLLTILITLCILVSFTLRRGVPALWGGPGWMEVSFLERHFYELVIGGLILVGAFSAVHSESRLGAVASLGVVGYSVALLYIIFSAPDLAMTQFVIETLTVILFVLVLYHLPRYSRLSARPARVRDGAVSLLVGGVMALLVLAVTHQSIPGEVSRFYSVNAVTAAHGRNVVNVILVDFRALDTLGEITVLAVAAIGVHALLKLRMEKGES